MKRFIVLFLVMSMLFAGCGAPEETPDAAVDIAPQATAPMQTPAPQSTPAGLAGYFICADCLAEFDTEAEFDSHSCAQDVYRTESLTAMAQPLAVVANLFEVEGISYPAEDVVSDYALSYLFIYANLYLSDRAAEAEVESEFFDQFIALEAGELSILLDAAFGDRFHVEDLALEDAASVFEKEGIYYIGASEVIPAAASYQGFGTLGEAETQEYLYNYSVTLLDEEFSGTFSVELVPSTVYEGSLCLGGVYLG